MEIFLLILIGCFHLGFLDSLAPTVQLGDANMTPALGRILRVKNTGS